MTSNILDDRCDLVPRSYIKPLILARLCIIIAKLFFKEVSVHDRFVIQRACRYANKNLHEKHPDWFDPTWVRRDDASDLSELVNARQEPCPIGPSLESHARMGVDLFLVRDREDRKNSLQGKIVALVTYGVLYTFQGRVGVVTDVYLHPHDPHIALDIRECIEQHFASIGIRRMSCAEIFTQSRRPKTDYSGIELAERCDTALSTGATSAPAFVPLYPPSRRVSYDEPTTVAEPLSAAGRMKC